MKLRYTLAVSALALATAASLSIPHAAAALPLVEPGDRIETNASTCTLGWAYTGRDNHTYGVTAGHCSPRGGETVRDEHTGVTGTFRRPLVDPPGIGGADFGLIDFGIGSLPVPFVADQPVESSNYPEPRPGQQVCRSGITTGKRCGVVIRSFGKHQYLTTGMTPTLGGDSGAPVWTTRSNGTRHIIGIWLGSRTTIANATYGRFADLNHAITTLGQPPIHHDTNQSRTNAR